jgi:hypothetical protein
VNAVSIAVAGERNKIKVSSRQHGGTGTANSPDKEPRHWLKVAGTLLGVLLAVLAALFALMQAQGWRFIAN